MPIRLTCSRLASTALRRTQNALTTCWSLITAAARRHKLTSRLLHASDRVQYLFNSSRNIGKGKAWELIFSAAPGEVIAYADGDVLFESGWLERAMELLESYPDVGMVSCRPMRTYDEGHTATQSGRKKNRRHC